MSTDDFKYRPPKVELRTGTHGANLIIHQTHSSRILENPWVLARTKRGERLPLSFAQQRLWFLAQMEGGSEAYHMPLWVRMQGALDTGALRRALDRIVVRHEILRTRFAVVEGEPVQRIQAIKQARFELREEDLRERGETGEELVRRMQEEVECPFDLTSGPLIRGQLLQVGEDEHILLITMHHIVSDEWSMSIFLNELNTLYAAYREGRGDPLPELEVQYADYAVWQRQLIEGEMLQQQAEYWKGALAGAPALLELPWDHARPAQQNYSGGLSRFELDETLLIGLKELGRRHGATLFMTLLGGWAALMGRLSGQEEVVIGIPVANRGRVEIEKLIGFFVNTLAVRVNVSGEQTVGKLLEQTKMQALAAQQHQDIPFEQVVELVNPQRSLAHSPLFQVMFAWQNAPEGRLEFPGVEIEVLHGGSVKATFDLTLCLHKASERIRGGVEYATSLFESQTVARYLGYFRRLLEGMVVDEGQRVDQLSLLSETERQQLLHEWNGTAVGCTKERCLHQLFEEQVAKTPEAIAVVYDDQVLSYGELNRQANQLAHYLRKMGVKPDTRVGICVERGMDMIVGLLGILKAGGAYVPLDPGYPAERLQFMLQDSGPAVVLTQAHLQHLFSGMTARLPLVDMRNAEEWRNGPEDNLESIDLTSRHLAYLIYTSGSSGLPKGVMVEHRAVSNRITALRIRYEVCPQDRLLQFASINFDQSVEEIFCAVLSGATLVLRTDAWLVGAKEFWALCAKKTVSILDLPTRFWQQILDDGSVTIPEGIRLIIIGGEAVDYAAVSTWFKRKNYKPKLLNTYGPTEGTIVSSVHELTADASHWRSIGRPIPNSFIYVLDKHGEPVPVGVVGELYIGGGGVARGYLNRPGLTAERFVFDPFSGDTWSRMYKTGDVGRWLADGSIEFVGRNDFQVKVRGFRIELGEIEARLLEHGGVREAVVMARGDEGGEKRLVAYYTETAGLNQTGVGAKELRAFLLASLPEYMVPAAYVRMESLPLMANGKLDRKALPAPDNDAFARQVYEAPQGEMETAMAGIWAEVLKLERVGRRDNFFELGGHSLLAVPILSRVQSQLGMQMKLTDLFTYPVVAELVRKLSAAGRWELPPMTQTERGEQLPLSFAQQRLWFLGQMEGGSEAYHIPLRMRMRGALDTGALRRALDRIVARHEVLRTRFAVVQGEPVQKIEAVEQARFELREEDLRERGETSEELARRIEEEGERAFDLTSEPLIRGQLLQVGEDEHILLITMHHIVSDEWSIGIFVNELNTLYAPFREGQGDPLPELELQYADYAVWQRNWMEGYGISKAQGRYWKKNLAGAPALLELPWDHARPAQQNYSGRFSRFELEETLLIGLKELGRRHGATLFMTLLGGWAALMGRLSGQEDVVIGIPVANRGRAEIKNLIGFFVNTLAMRVNVAGERRVGGLLEGVKRDVLLAQENQELPFERVVEIIGPERSLSHTPLFNVMFAWQNGVEGKVEFPGVEIEVLSAGSVKAKFDLSLSLQETSGRIRGGVEYATALFEATTIERYQGYFRRLLAGMVADENQRLNSIELMGERELEQVLFEWNETEAKYPKKNFIQELFEEQAEKTPHAVAIVYGNEDLTYGELNRRANQLAHYLRRMGVRPDTRVGICVERGFEMVTGLLAVLKAGGAYVPLDPAYPLERLRFMLEDSDPMVLLTQSHLADRFPELVETLPVLDLNNGKAPWKDLPDGNPNSDSIGLSPNNLAYVIYTSGSTGTPKGVMVEHGGLSKLVQWHCHVFGIGAGSHSSNVAGIGFDATICEVWPILCVGGTLFVPPSEKAIDPEALLSWWSGLDLDVSVLPTALAEFAFSRGIVSRSLGTLLVGGDHLRQLPAKGWNFSLVNVYGPTETTVAATTARLDEATSIVHIGRPIANTQVYILDTYGQPVPVGVAGELYIGGAGVGRGYLKRPELTAELFVGDPFSGDGSRMYKTGDLGRWLGDGNIECLGRSDFQVKIRGFRIELGEIESRLVEYPEVREAVVVAREDTPGDKRLVAYYTIAPNDDAEKETIEAERLRSHLLAKLPEYMVPAAYVRLELLPLTPNGKLDRKALPTPDRDAYAMSGYEGPVGETETTVAAIWAELLQLERVGRQDNFFQLGGHSLLATQVIARIRNILQVEMPLQALFESQTLASLAAVIEKARTGETGQEQKRKVERIERQERSEGMPLSFHEQGVYVMARHSPAYRSLGPKMATRLRGELNQGALERSLQEIVERHEILRTRYGMKNGREVRILDPAWEVCAAPAEIEEVETEEQVRQAVIQEQAKPFDLERGPLLRINLWKLNEQEHVLMLAMHHIISDGWSMSILSRELRTLYSGYVTGRRASLPALKIQYADYAIWQREKLRGEVFDRLLGYWMKRLGGMKKLAHLRGDRLPKLSPSLREEHFAFVLGKGATERIRVLGRKQGVTPFIVLLAIFKLWLYQNTATRDIAVVVPVSERNLIELEDVIGLLINMVLLHTEVHDDLNFEDFLRQLHGVSQEAFAHQALPFGIVHQALANSDFSRVMFDYINVPDHELKLPRLKADPVAYRGNSSTSWDVILVLREKSESIDCLLTFDADLFSTERVAELGEQLKNLLAQVLQAPQKRLSQYSQTPVYDYAQI